jgi:hypothetical protein
MDWSNVVFSVGSTVVTGSVAYGIILTKVQMLEAMVKANTARITELHDQMVTEAKKAHENFVGYRQFERFVEEVKDEQNEIKQDVKKLIEMVAGLSFRSKKVD